MIRRNMRSALTRLWSRIRALFSKAKTSARSGSSVPRTVRTLAPASPRKGAAPVRTAALLLTGMICVAAVSPAPVPTTASRTAATERTGTDDADDPDLPSPELSGITTRPSEITLALDSALSILSRGMTIEEKKYANRTQSTTNLSDNPPETQIRPATLFPSEPSGTDPEADAAVPVPVPTLTPEPVPIVFPTEYSVCRGETVWAIAERFYGSAEYVDLICYANGLSFYDPVIFNGQVLALPDPSTPVPAPTPSPATASPSSGASMSGYSDEEIDLYLRIVASECGSGWGYDGCLMISQVIVNRMLSGRWGGLYNVLTAPRQFTPYESGYYLRAVPNETQRQAAMDALNGAVIFGRDVLYFCTDVSYARSTWFQNMPIAAVYANTLFFAP